MGIITTEVEVKPSGKMIKYYKDKGYDAKHHEPLMVQIEDLPNHSDKIVEVLCDYCNKTISTMKYSDYKKGLNNVEKHACKNCIGEKIKDVMQKLYGVDNYGETEEYLEKIHKISLEKYGVSHYCTLDFVKEKREKTCLDKYGSTNYSSTMECKKKIKETNLKMFGVEYASQSEKVKEKVRNTNMKKYDVEWALQSPEIRAKVNETLCKNGTQKTSKQQLYLHSLYSGEINYPISYYAVDICFPEEKLIIEYDGGGHDLRVTLGRLTQEEFDQKEIVRNAILKKEGYKQIRIVSRKDYLPQDSTLLQMLSEAKQYFSETAHSWMTYDIDESRMINAENKDTNGIPYSFGELRTIKDSDLPTTTKTNNNINIKKGA